MKQSEILQSVEFEHGGVLVLKEEDSFIGRDTLILEDVELRRT